MIYNFRHDRTKTEEVLTRIRHDQQLSQGWGGGENGGLDLREEDFVNRTVSREELRNNKNPEQSQPDERIQGWRYPGYASSS